jgi:COMPASS component SWD2
MYWSLYDNTILVSFLGHTDQIIGLEMSNCDDNFLSSSKDGSVRLWNLNQRKLFQHISKAKYGCLDPMGKNIAVLSSAENQPKISTISLYPVGVSKAIATSNVEGAEIKVIKYSPTGKHIVCVSDNTLIIVETLNWKVVQKMDAIPNESGNVLDPSFTPDGKFIACGSDTGKITIWEIETGNCVISLDKHFKFVNCVQFNYKHILLASACQNLLLWSPDEKLLSTKIPDKA